MSTCAVSTSGLAQRLRRAVEEAYAHNWLGRNIQGSGFDLDVVIHRGAGAYICGEETALLTSLEGGKGFPRIKPPFPALVGLFQCPTIVNNVETLACVPFILREGAKRFAALGTARQGGTRLFSVCGHVNRPGLYEAPVSVTLRELIERYAQGVRGGRTLKAVIPGGISAKVLTAAEIDVCMDFDSLTAAGTMAGSGGVIVMDDTTSMLEALQSAAKFFAHESCGQCSPCREGTGWIHRIVGRIAAGRGKASGPGRSAGHRARHGGQDDLCVCRRSGLARPVLHHEVPLGVRRAHPDREMPPEQRRCGMPTLTIDRRQVDAPDGSTVIQAAEQARCLHPALLLPPRALDRRKLPHLPRGSGAEPQAPDRLQYAGDRRDGCPHRQRQGPGRPARGARVPPR